MESIDIRDFTSVTALDSDNLLLSRADGSAAKVSLAALKAALGEVFAAKAALTTEATHRADADSALRTDLVGVTRSVEDLVAANEQTLASFAEVRAINTAQDAALASEVTRATTAEAAILATALGGGAQTAWAAPMKLVNVSSTAVLQRRLNTDLTSGVRDHRGVVTYRYAQTGEHFLVLTSGLNEAGYPTNGQRGCLQLAVGSISIDTSTLDDTGHDWADDGVPNGLNFAPQSMNVLVRRLSYSGQTRTISKWTDYGTFLVESSTTYAAKNTDEAMRGIYKLNNGQLSACTYNADTGLYAMNGLTDITPEEMSKIWAFTANKQPGIYGLASLSVRTNYGFNVKHSLDANGVTPQNFYGLFQGSTLLEVASLCTNAQYGLRAENLRNIFYNCYKLHTITGGKLYLDRVTATSGLTDMFKGCAALKNVNIYGLKISGLSFADSPNLSAASVAYLIANAANTSAITVKVHADTLGNIYGEQGEWSAIRTAAAAKNIEFTT